MSRVRRWQKYFEDCRTAARSSQPFMVSGRLTRVLDPLGRSSAFQYDAADRVSQQILPSNGSEDSVVVYGYDAENVFITNWFQRMPWETFRQGWNAFIPRLINMRQRGLVALPMV